MKQQNAGISPKEGPEERRLKKAAYWPREASRFKFFEAFFLQIDFLTDQ